MTLNSVFYPMLFAIALFAAPVALGQEVSSDCPRAVAHFLATSSSRSLDLLSRIDGQSCWKVFGESDAKQKELNDSVKHGDRWAARYLATHLKDLDGGNLEDSLISLGEFAEHDMQDFLFLRKRGLLSTREFSDSLTMLPESTVDNPRAQLRRMGLRRSKVLGVHRSDLSGERDQALTSIDRSVSEIRSKSPDAKN